MRKIIYNLRIKKLVYKGYGLGFKNSVPIFVTNAIPGDIVDVEIIYKKKDVLFGKILDIKEKSKLRITPICEAFGKCGGCDWLNISYENQLQFKQQLIEEIFLNIHIEKIFRITASDNEMFYRNKSFLPIAKVNNELIIGMFAHKSHKVIPHKKCQIQAQIFDKVGKKFLYYLKAGNVKIYNENSRSGTVRHLGFRFSSSLNKLLVIVVTKNRKLPFTKQLVRILTDEFPNIFGIIQNINPLPINTILGNEEKILWGKDYIFEKIGNMKFKLNYKSFFQINTLVAHKLYNFVKDNIDENSNVIDAFSGVGTIGIYISDKAKSVYCIENNERAGKNAVQNAAINKISNCKFFTNNVEIEVPKLCENHRIDTIIFDPPRKGLEKNTINSISKNNIPKIIYISCNPMVQVRDVKQLLLKGYKITKLQPFDMFPQTYHIENVLILKRNN